MKNSKSTLKTVIADDDRFLLRDLKDCLIEAGYEVEGEAHNGLEMVKLCSELKPDIAIVDIKMPLMDGMTATGKIVSGGLAKCVIVLTSFDDSETVDRAIEAGASGYMTKPLDKNLLVPTIESAMKSSAEFFEMRKKIANVNKRVENREIIEKAKLMLMNRYSVSETQAYDNMREISRKHKMSMAEVAEIIISRGGPNG